MAEEPGKLLPIKETQVGFWVLNIPHTAKPDYDFERACIGMDRVDIETEILINWNASSGMRIYEGFDPDVHVSKTELHYYPTLPLCLGWDWGLCFSDDTEILTATGWKFFRDLQADEEVATRDPKTGEMTYAAIQARHVYDYDGELLEWKSNNVNFCVTPQHEIPVTTESLPGAVRFESAASLAERPGIKRFVDVASRWEGSDPGRLFDMPSTTFARFMGLYLSEGSVEKIGNHYRISIYQKEDDLRFSSVLECTGRNWKRTPSGKAAGWRTGDRTLGAYLLALGKVREKRVPAEVKGLPSELIREFIDHYLMGDGKTRQRPNGSVERTIFTVSKQMADDLQELAQKAGWAAPIRRVKPQRSVMKGADAGRVIQNNGGYSITIRKNAVRSRLRARMLRRVPYTGKVYCVTVPHHTVYIRRGGVPSWNGNSPACLIAQLNPMGQLQIFPSLAPEEREYEGIYAFAERVADHLLKNYCMPHGKSLKELQTYHVGDPAGRAMLRHSAGGRTSRELFSCFQILNTGLTLSLGEDEDGLPAREHLPGWGWLVYGGEISHDKRQEAVRARLRWMIRPKVPALIVDPREEFLQQCMMGGYRRKVFSDGTYDRNPMKSHESHLANALEYLCSRLRVTPARPEEERDEDRPRREPFRSQSSAYHRG